MFVFYEVGHKNIKYKNVQEFPDFYYFFFVRKERNCGKSLRRQFAHILEKVRIVPGSTALWTQKNPSDCVPEKEEMFFFIR